MNTEIPVTGSVIVLSVTFFFFLMGPEAAAYHINRLGDACLSIQQWLLHD